MRVNYFNVLQLFLMNSTQQKKSTKIGTFIGSFQEQKQHEYDAEYAQNGKVEKENKFSNMNLPTISGPMYPIGTQLNQFMLNDPQGNSLYFIDLESVSESVNLFLNSIPPQEMEQSYVPKKEKKRKPQKNKKENNTRNQETFQKRKRTDGNRATQNAASKAFTLSLNIIWNGQKKRAKKQEMKNQFLNFLEENNAKSAQTVLIFIYIYLSRLKTQPENFNSIGTGMLQYYDATIGKYKQQKVTQLRYAAYRKIIQNYYMKYDGKEINLQWVKLTFKPLFHGKQESRVQEQIKKIESCLENFDPSELINDYQMNTPSKTSNQ